MSNTIRAKVDTELTRRVGTWFTVRQIQDKLRINPSTLKPLIMKYAREELLKRRHVKGTARSVEFTPAAGSETAFKTLLTSSMPYRNLTRTAPKMSVAAKKTTKKVTKKVAPKAAAPKAAKKAAKKTSRKAK